MLSKFSSQIGPKPKCFVFHSTIWPFWPIWPCLNGQRPMIWSVERMPDWYWLFHLENCIPSDHLFFNTDDHERISPLKSHIDSSLLKIFSDLTQTSLYSSQISWCFKDIQGASYGVLKILFLPLYMWKWPVHFFGKYERLKIWINANAPISQPYQTFWTKGLRTKPAGNRVLYFKQPRESLEPNTQKLLNTFKN
jgi:hypothetical protein